MIHPYAYRSGLIAGIISVIYTIIAYFSGLELYTNMWIPWIFIVGIIIYFIMSLKKIKSFLGFMTFKQGFINFFIMSIIYITMMHIANFLVVNVIDPEFGMAVNDIVIEKVIGFMESMGTPEVAITEAVFEMEEGIESQKTFLGLLTNIASWTFWFSVIGLISAAVLKSKNDVIIETVD